MERKHQVYVIKNNKCVAALHHQSLYGKEPVRRLADFVIKLKHNSPTRALRIAFRDGVLLDSTEFDPMSHINDEGITIVDITNQQDIKYCFMNIHLEMFKPLSAEEYVQAYHPELSKIERVAIRRLSKFAIISLDTVLKTWESFPVEQSREKLTNILSSVSDEIKKKIIYTLKHFSDEKLNNKETQISSDELLSLYDQLDFLDIKTKMDIYEWVFITVNSVNPDTEQRVREGLAKRKESELKLKALLARENGPRIKKVIEEFRNTYLPNSQTWSPEINEFFDIFYSMLEGLDFQIKEEIFEWVFVAATNFDTNSKEIVIERLKKEKWREQELDRILYSINNSNIKDNLKTLTFSHLKKEKPDFFLDFYNKLDGLDFKTKLEIYKWMESGIPAQVFSEVKAGLQVTFKNELGTKLESILEQTEQLKKDLNFFNYKF